MKKIEILFRNNSYFTREAYKTLRTNISFCGDDIKTICITSCEANEGKSTISLELAKSLAEINKRVLLIDADLRKSVLLSKNTNESNLNGLSQLLAGHVSTTDVIFSTQTDNLDIIFAGQYPPNPSELLNSKKFTDLMTYSKANYDYIIIDTPPLGLVIDAAVVAEQCDGAIIVIAKDMVKFSRAKSVKEQIEKSGCKILGTIMNEVNKSKRSLSDAYYRKGKYSKYSKYDKYSHY